MVVVHNAHVVRGFHRARPLLGRRAATATSPRSKSVVAVGHALERDHGRWRRGAVTSIRPASSGRNETAASIRRTGTISGVLRARNIGDDQVLHARRCGLGSSDRLIGYRPASPAARTRSRTCSAICWMDTCSEIDELRRQQEPGQRRQHQDRKADRGLRTPRSSRLTAPAHCQPRAGPTTVPAV